jgi:hypothetical protein
MNKLLKNSYATLCILAAAPFVVFALVQVLTGPATAASIVVPELAWYNPVRWLGNDSAVVASANAAISANHATFTSAMTWSIAAAFAAAAVAATAKLVELRHIQDPRAEKLADMAAEKAVEAFSSSLKKKEEPEPVDEFKAIGKDAKAAIEEVAAVLESMPSEEPIRQAKQKRKEEPLPSAAS